MGGVWTAVVVWVLLAVPAAVLLGRTIRHAEQRALRHGRHACPPTGTAALVDPHLTSPGGVAAA